MLNSSVYMGILFSVQEHIVRRFNAIGTKVPFTCGFAFAWLSTNDEEASHEHGAAMKAFSPKFCSTLMQWASLSYRMRSI